jgi:CRP/FNR family transcriptional regulator, cyclic AMP receptor protein
MPMKSKLLQITHDKREVRSFAAGNSIFNEGQPGDAMYLVLDGEVDLLINGLLVEQLGRGGVLGEMALLESAPRTASAVARTDCKLIVVDEKRFALMVQHTPDFALQIMRVMAGRLRTMDKRLSLRL